MPERPSPASKPDLMVVDNAAALNRAAAREFCRCAEEAVAERGRFAVALSGGNTPRGVYSLLAEEHRNDLPWDKIFVFFGDERHAPPNSPDSNYRMANEALLSLVPLPQGNVFRVRGELPAKAAADDYDGRVRDFFGVANGNWPAFDLVLLGIGEDGHTASLFPGSTALNERSRLVVANWVEKFRSYRITFTFPVLDHAAEVLFLVSGEGKSQIVRDIFGPAPSPTAYPAQMVRPQRGRLLWIVDKAAAHLL